MNTVLCDFDGTITIQDTAEWILDKFAEGDWRALDDLYVQGKIGLLECMRAQFALVKVDRALMLDELRKSIMIREGFTGFAGYCHDNDARLIIVSAGLDFVIKHFVASMGVAEEVGIYSAKTVDEDGHIGFRFPPLKMPGSRTFKDDLVRQYKANGNVVTYLGDGMPDTEACAISDNRFAVKGRRLETELIFRGLPFISFENFSEIMPTMARILDEW